MTPGTGAARDAARPMRISLVFVRILIPPRAIACLLLGVWLPLATAVGDPMVISVRLLSDTLVVPYRLLVVFRELRKLLPSSIWSVGMLQVPLVIYPMPLSRVTFPRSLRPDGTDVPDSILMNVLTRLSRFLLLL